MNEKQNPDQNIYITQNPNPKENFQKEKNNKRSPQRLETFFLHRKIVEKTRQIREEKGKKDIG